LKVTVVVREQTHELGIIAPHPGAPRDRDLQFVDQNPDAVHVVLAIVQFEIHVRGVKGNKRRFEEPGEIVVGGEESVVVVEKTQTAHEGEDRLGVGETEFRSLGGGVGEGLIHVE